MKFHICLILCCLLLLITLDSCEKDGFVVDGREIVLTPEQVLSLQVQQDIVFQFVHTPGDDGMRKGWILDGHGQVLRYAIADDFQWSAYDNQVLSEDHLSYIWDAAIETGVYVEAEVFLQKYRDLLAINADHLSDASPTQDQNGSGFFAYRITDEETTVEACGGNINDQGVLRNFEKVTIDVNADEVIQNQSPALKSLANWLSDLNDSLN